MSGPRIALLMDHPQRDLAGLVLTALALCERGASCGLVPLNLRERETFALRPDFVVLNFARRGTESFVERLRAAGIGYCVLETEGVVWSNLDEYVDLFWRDPVLRATIRASCLWGPRLADQLVERGVYTVEQVHVTGCPRYDFYHPRWRSVLVDEPVARAAAHRTILVNTNYTLTNSRFATEERNVAALRASMDISDARVGEYLTRERGAIAAVIDLVQRLSADFPAARILLRPHPFEQLETYRGPLEGLPNVELDGVGPVLPRLVGSAIVIQRSCTTGLDAAMAGTPALSPRWVTPPSTFPDAEAVSEGCATYAALRDRVGAALAGAYVMPADVRRQLDGVIAANFFRIDGVAHERVRDVILSSIRAGDSALDDVCSRYLYDEGPGAETIGTRVGRRVRRRLGLNPEFSFAQMRTVPAAAWERSDKQFSVDDVRRLVDRIGTARRAAGQEPAAVRVHLAREDGGLAHGFHGHTVMLTPA